MITDMNTDRHTMVKYLQNRDIPTDDVSMQRNGLEYAGTQKIVEVLGFCPGSAPIGIIIKYPGTDYSTVRLIPGGPRCPKNQAPQAYLPTSTDWDSVTGRIIICESPIKALTWARHGYNALSAAGTTTVYMAAKDRWCEGFPHSAIETGAVTEVTIAWDSDAQGGLNHNVERDLRTLTRALRDRHPALKVSVHALPEPPEGYDGKKWGCDDFHHHHGAEKFALWAADRGQEVTPGSDPLQDHLDDMNTKYAVLEGSARVICLEHGYDWSVRDFVTLIEAPRAVVIEDKRTPVAPIWLQWAGRNGVNDLQYIPGGERMVPGEYYNLWKDDGVIPVAGSVLPWMNLMDDAIEDKDVMHRMLQCMAYQVQNRGTRLPKLLYFTGRQMGTGKSTMAKIMSKILGPSNSSVITKQEFEGTFNACWARRELAVLDDCEALSRGSWSKMKQAITTDRMMITEKHVRAAVHDTYSVLYITANSNDILSFDEDERRVLMIHFNPRVLHREDTDTYWREFHKWLEGKGYAAIAHYLMTFDLTDFDPNFYPPSTETKKRALAATQEESDGFISDFLKDPAEFLPPGREFVTSRELFTLSTGNSPSEINRVEQKDFTRALNRTDALTDALPDHIRPRIGGYRCMVYALPGVKLSETNMMIRVRNNIKKYDIKLD